ncbi:MAG TPA: alpha/beta fold hydrolase [Ktedonobacteraceae bacterium]|nr:alpha/beta fold hydrolase [Ktedonobacteraceae bacterium]
MKSLQYEDAQHSARLHYLDWLRVLAVLGVFYAHAIDIFDMYHWHIREMPQDAGLIDLAVVGTQWGMSLFFFLAGASALFALSSRTSREFMSERFKRLIIPCVVGIILFSPPQAYLIASSQGLYQGSLLQYFPSFFANVHLSLNPQWVGAYGFHLWFLAFLFGISMVALPVLLSLKRMPLVRFISNVAAWSEKPGGLFVFVLPIALAQVVLCVPFPGYQNWADFAVWLFIFIFGAILFVDPRFKFAVQKQWKLSLFVAITSLFILLAAYFGGVLGSWGNTSSYTVTYVLYEILLSIFAWSWLLFVLYFGMRFLDFSNTIIDYCDEAVLPFYVLHYPVIVVIAFFTFSWHIATSIQFFFVTTSALIATLIVYDLFVRRIKIMRRLFGMKPTITSGVFTQSYMRLSFHVARKVAFPRPKAITKTPADLGLSYRDVNFVSRENQLQLSGWFIPGILANGQLTADRTIIMVHGLGSNRAALEAGLLDLSAELARQGFAVLAFDMRGQGKSSRAPISMGYFEQFDVLGAIDFLRSGPLPYPELGRPCAIGGWGISMGASAMLLAAAREPAIHGVVADCAFAAFVPLIQRDLKVPNIIIPGMTKAMFLLYDIDYYAIRPVDVVASIAPRPLLFIQSGTDSVVPPWNMKLLADAASTTTDARVETWQVPEADHIQAYHVMGTAYVKRVVTFFTTALDSAVHSGT